MQDRPRRTTGLLPVWLYQVGHRRLLNIETHCRDSLTIDAKALPKKKEIGQSLNDALAIHTIMRRKPHQCDWLAGNDMRVDVTALILQSPLPWATPPPPPTRSQRRHQSGTGSRIPCRKAVRKQSVFLLSHARPSPSRRARGMESCPLMSSGRRICAVIARA
jgi:hypothetical protein